MLPRLRYVQMRPQAVTTASQPPARYLSLFVSASASGSGLVLLDLDFRVRHYARVLRRFLADERREFGGRTHAHLESLRR